MSVRDPGEIWKQSEEEGERRLSRSIAGLLATGLVGGLDVMLGIVALVVTTGAMEAVMPEATAHLIGFILAAPSLNHAVVSFGEMSFGLMAGTGDAEWADLAQNFPIAVAGNLIGGFVFVTVARFVQMRGEPA